MNVNEVMTSEPRTCAPGTSVAEAAAIMLEADCGILPVVENDKLIGVVTDRDLCIALATRNVRASDISVGDVTQRSVLTCRPEDDVDRALTIMKEHQVRRLPVQEFGGRLIGIVSMNDIVLATGPRKLVRETAVVDTLQGICAHHQTPSHIAAA
jgi:CBS domain-containing protein